MAAKKQKYMETMFRAGGESLAQLTAAYHEQSAVYKRLRVFEDEIFGAPKKGDESEVMGLKIRNYGARPHPAWEKDGEFLGFRFDWAPLNKEGGIRYAIEPIIVPLGWVEVPSHPGIYRPDPANQPNLSATLATLRMPYYENLPAVSGTQPIITVNEYKGCAPRAYQAWPDIHVVNYKKGELNFYIDVPRDYKGQVFQPTDSTPLLQKDWWEFRNGYGDMYEPHNRRPEGVPLPVDYATKYADEIGGKFFQLAGLSLKIYKGWVADQEKSSQATSRLMKAWKAGSHSYCGTELVYADFKEAPGAGWIKTDPQSRRNEYSPDPSTAEGRAILETYASLPQRPGLIELQKRFNEKSAKGLYPQIHHHTNGAVIAEYSTDKGPVTTPPGAKKIDGRVFSWLKADQSDYHCGMLPPPPPADLIAGLDNFSAVTKKQMPKGPAPF